MARKRLTTRTARDMESKPGTQVMDKGSKWDNDPYDMNDTGHEKNDPDLTEYQKGDPSAWAEDPNMKDPAAQDQNREETMHAPLIDKQAASEAVASVKVLQQKAVKSIVASQRMLPGAPDEIIEKQATIFMRLPDDGLNATLAHQEALAKNIAKAAGDAAEEDDDEEKAMEEGKKMLQEKKAQLEALQKEIEAGQNDPRAFYESKKKKEAAKKKDEEEEEEVESGSMCKSAEEEEEEEGKKEEGEEKEAAKYEAGEGEEKKEEKKEEEEGEEGEEESGEEEEGEEEEKSASGIELEASDDNILDQIFSTVTASEEKKGASKLSGMVKKQASQGSDNLSGLWGAPPDVSGLFQ